VEGVTMGVIDHSRNHFVYLVESRHLFTKA
jgi:hypothetical protein